MTIYIKIRHWLFWYGQYQLCEKSCNDEFWVYADYEQETELAYFDVSSKKSLEYLLSPESDELDDEPEWKSELQTFYNSNNLIHYMYLYPNSETEFSFSNLLVPQNEKGLYPNYIIVYTKNNDEWDTESISECAKTLIDKYLNIDVDHVEILDAPTYEETKKAFIEDLAEGAKF